MDCQERQDVGFGQRSHDKAEPVNVPLVRSHVVEPSTGPVSELSHVVPVRRVIKNGFNRHFKLLV